MDLRAKLQILADAAKYDASCASSGGKRQTPKGGLGNSEGMGICHSYTPDGRCVSLLKILFTNVCIYDCVYCINRVSSSVKRARFTVAEVVWLTMEFYRRNYIEGLFLSSGIAQSSDATMEDMIEVARRLRVDERFGGYIHLKAVAGASPALLAKAGLYADRLSANIELPTQPDLDQLAPAKTHAAIEGSMATMSDKIAESREKRRKTMRAPVFASAGQSTQMIVGATPTADRAILDKASRLYDGFGLRRVYYSAFSPIPAGDPRLPIKSPPLIREHRLYQADWLMRFYGFKADEITTTDAPQLDLDRDPKTAWALRNRHLFPVDVNKGSRSQLLRVPGLGVKNVDRILSMRRLKQVTLIDLAKLRVPLDKTRYFIVTADRNPDAKLIDSEDLVKLTGPKPRQLTIFDAGATLDGPSLTPTGT